MTDVAEPVAVNPDATHQAWSEANLKPLWEQAAAHGGTGKRERAYRWAWEAVHPLVVAATKLRGMDVTERRVLTMMNPNPNPNGAPGAISNLTAAR
jgi:gentisate 1,2-dioxygenase